MVFAGNANPELAQRIAELLGTALGKVSVETFSDGEICVEIMENVVDVMCLSSSPPVRHVMTT